MPNPKNMTKIEMTDLSNLRHVRNLLKTSLTVVDYITCTKWGGSNEAIKEVKQNIERSITCIDNEIRKYN